MSIIKLNNRAVKDVSAFGSISGLGSLTLIKKQTASSSATVSFVDGSSGVVLDNTYKEYIFYFLNLHTSASSTGFKFKPSINGGSSYGVATTTTSFMAEQSESSNDPFLGYRTGNDHAQDTGSIFISENFGNDNDQSGSGIMRLFNPSDTTFVKHFLVEMHSSHSADYLDHCFVSGYINTTSAVNGIQFLFNSGNIDSGDILLFGLK